jgi:hypothetical protein
MHSTANTVSRLADVNGDGVLNILYPVSKTQVNVLLDASGFSQFDYDDSGFAAGQSRNNQT